MRHAEWWEFDLANAEWRIRPEKMKMRRLHRVPLSRQSIVLLRALQAISGQGRYLFPSVSSFARPICENTLNAALRRLGYSSRQTTTHGFRTITRLERGYPDFQSFLAEAEILRDFGQKWRPERKKSKPLLPPDVWGVPENWKPELPGKLPKAYAARALAVDAQTDRSTS